MQEAFAIDYIYSCIWRVGVERVQAGQECPVSEDDFKENRHFSCREAGQECPVLLNFPTRDGSPRAFSRFQHDRP
jgi:hypothetical protein